MARFTQLVECPKFIVYIFFLDTCKWPNQFARKTHLRRRVAKLQRSLASLQPLDAHLVNFAVSASSKLFLINHIVFAVTHRPMFVHLPRKKLRFDAFDQRPEWRAGGAGNIDKMGGCDEMSQPS